MDGVEQNIDAYRIVFEILNEMRSMLRHELERVHGRDWPRAGLPRQVLERLIERKEKEKSIDWYETEYQELTDFAGFEDLLHILEHNSTLLGEVRKLAPSPALLHARFLELEVMCSKLGLARPISENELSFLGTFHLRFRKALEAQGAAPQAVAAPPPAREPAALTVEEEDEEVAATVEIEEPVAAGPPPKATPKKPTPPPVAPVKPPSNAPASQMLHPDGAERLEPPKAAPASAAAQLPAIDTALENNDHRAIFRELYREVMELAEGLWTSDLPGNPKVWDKVRVSEWYELNFARRGLKPLSDFYEVLSQVWERMHQGMARDELQDFLKKSNFAQLLLSLRDMFQKNQV